MKRTLILGKRPSAVVAAMLTVMASMVLVAVLLMVSAVLMSAGYLLAAMRRRSGRKKTPSDWYAFPVRSLDFTPSKPIRKTPVEFLAPDPLSVSSSQGPESLKPAML